MSGRPVLQSTFELHLWKKLDKGSFPNDGPMAFVREMGNHEGPFNSAVLVMLIGALAESGDADAETVRGIVARSRPGDVMPSVKACEAMLDAGDADAAESMLAMSDGGRRPAERRMAAARLAMARGDRAGAREEALAAYGEDPSCRAAYGLLAELDWEGGWLQRENVLDAMSGAEPTNPPGSGPAQDLYEIYADWFGGRRDEATERLVGHPWYVGRDPDFLLASARISADEMDWHSASMVYDELMAGNAPPFVLVEAAEAALGAREPERALGLLSRADAGSVRVQRAVARARLLMGDTAGMLEAIRAVLECEGSGSDQFIAAAHTLVNLGMDREAMEVIDRYAKYSGDDSSTYTMRSVIRMRSGDYVSAMDAAQRAVSADRGSAEARVQMARMLHLTGKTRSAEAECQEILKKDDSNVAALSLLRDMQASEGDSAAVVETCRRLVAINPADAASLIRMGEALALTDDQPAARDAYKRALRADSSREAAVSAVSSMISCGMHRDAANFCESLERQFAGDAMLKRLRGNALYALGDFEEASEAFASSLAADPDSAVVWHSKGMADEACGEMELAERSYDRAVLLDHGEPEYWVSKAVARAHAEDVRGAVEALNRAIELEPRAAGPLVMKAGVLASASRHAEALYCVRQAEVVCPGDARIIDMEIAELEALGDAEGAAGAMRRRLEAEGSTEVSLRLARNLASGGDAEGASAVLERAAGADPESAELASERERLSAAIAERAAEATPEPELEPEPEPEPEPKKKADPAALAAKASAQLAAGSYKSAKRNADRALEADPDNPDLRCLKARIALASGDADGAAFLADNALASAPRHAGLHTVNALAREAKGNLDGALSEVDLAIINGADTAEAHSLKGRLLEAVGQPERAAFSYANAVAADPGDLDAVCDLARIRADAGDSAGALSALNRAIERAGPTVRLVLLKARVCDEAGDADGIVESYEQFMQCQEVTDGDRMRMVRILEDHGRSDLGRSIIGVQEPREFDDHVKRAAERVLRRAHLMRLPADDPEVMETLGLGPETAEEVSAYIGGLQETGDLEPGTEEFEALERLSHDVVLKMEWRELDDRPRLPLEKVFVVGGFKDADSAKELVAFVHKAMFASVGPDSDPSLAGAAEGLTGEESLYDIMIQRGLGVYGARVVKAMASVGSPSSPTS